MFDTKTTKKLLVAFGLSIANPNDSLPLAPNGDDRMDRREDPESGLPEVVLQTIEDEGGIGRMGLDDGSIHRHFLATNCV